MSTIDFYYNPMSPPARGAWMVLEELGIKYTGHIVDLIKGEQKTEAYKQINIRQKVPALRDGDLTIGESRAIAGYLVSEYGAKVGKQSLYPSDPRQRAVIDQHLYISENFSDDLVSYANYGGVLFGNGKPKLENIDRVRRALRMLEDCLEQHEYVASDTFTIADIFYYVILGFFSMSDFDEYSSYPKIQAWQAKMKALPYHKKTFEEPQAEVTRLYRGKLEGCNK